MKQIKVNENCNGCGLCVLSCRYLTENAEGNAIPVAGMAIAEEDMESVKKVINNCPQHALAVYETGLTNKTGRAGIEEFKEKAIEKLKNLPKREIPRTSEYRFDGKEYKVSFGSAKGQNRYDYSSYDRAMRAGKDEFERVAYSQLQVAFTKIWMEYKTKYIKPYYTLTSSERNYYTEHNKKIEKILGDIYAEMKALGCDGKITEEFLKCEVFPVGDNAKLCAKHEALGNDIVEDLINEFKKDSCLGNKEHYTCQIDVDYDEVYEGSGFWGDKYKKKYCYSGVNVAIRELQDEIIWFFNYADIEERCESWISWLVEDYNRNLEKFIDSRIEMIKKL